MTRMMNGLMGGVKVGVAFGVVGAAASLAAAQDLAVKALPQTRPVVISNATVHTVSGATIEKGHVVFAGGVISAVGPGPAEPRLAGQDALVIDGAGKHVYPGLFGANTVMGLVEVNAARATRDADEIGDLTPEVRPAPAINPDSTLIPVTRSNGVLLNGVMPLGGLVPGRVSVIRLDGWTWEDMTVREDAGLLVNWPNLRTSNAWWATRSEGEQQEDIRRSLERVGNFFDDAIAYHAAKKAGAGTVTDLRFEAVGAVIRGERPVYARADEWEQIESAAAFCAARKLKLVIVGGRDAPLAAESLRAIDAGVIVTGTFRMPKREDSPTDDAFTLPARLEAAKVRWCLAGEGGEFQTAHERNLPYHAALAVAHGLDRVAAIRAITLSPAELLGVANRYGSIDAGKSATLIVTTGDPLEMTTKIEHAFIDGRGVDLRNKQTELDAKYREKYRRQKQ